VTTRSPDRGFAAATAAIVGFFVAAVLPRATWPLIDGDVWWHIRAGELVLQTGGIARVDSWSIVASGRPWTSQDWLANVILALGERGGAWGETGLSFLFGALTVVAFWVMWRAIAVRAPGIGWMSRIVWLSVGLLLAGPVMGVRVQVLDLLMATGVVWISWRYLADPRRRWLIGLPVITVVWANLHAGWALVFLIGGAVLAGEAVDRLLKRRLEDSPPLAWAELRDLAVALVVSAGALVINPNGIDLYAYPFYTVGITALSRYVMEWFPASLGDLFGWLLLGFVVVAVIPSLAWGRGRLRTSDALILIGLTIMTWRAIRFLLILGPIGGAVAAVVLAPRLSRTELGRRVSPALQRLARPRGGAFGAVNLGLATVLVVIGLGVAFLRVNPDAQASEIARSLPVAAVHWMDEHDPGERIFNKYEWGGYIGEKRPDRLIFMDGRADVYGDELLRQYVSVIGVEDPQAVFDRYAIDHVVFPPDTPLAAWLDASPLWERAHADPTAVIWVRAGERQPRSD